MMSQKALKVLQEVTTCNCSPPALLGGRGPPLLCLIAGHSTPGTDQGANIVNFHSSLENLNRRSTHSGTVRINEVVAGLPGSW